jgi:hypothetical protein
MMKISFLFIFLAGFTSECAAQATPIDSVNISFAPSFIYPCKLTIKLKPDSPYAKLIYNKDATETALVKSADSKWLTEFLETYKYKTR